MWVWTCGPKDEVKPPRLKLGLVSAAPVENPPGWKDLWRLSPFCPIAEGMEVPGLPGARSLTVENAWQMLKIWPGEDGWRRADAEEAFRSPIAIRYPRGRGRTACGFYWGETGETLSLVEARRRIYAPLYLAMLRCPEQAALLGRLQCAAVERGIVVWDFDSYDVLRCGMSDLSQAMRYESRSFAHSFIAALAITGREAAIWNAGNRA